MWNCKSVGQTEMFCATLRKSLYFVLTYKSVQMYAFKSHREPGAVSTRDDNNAITYTHTHTRSGCIKRGVHSSTYVYVHVCISVRAFAYILRQNARPVSRVCTGKRARVSMRVRINEPGAGEGRKYARKRESESERESG